MIWKVGMKVGGCVVGKAEARGRQPAMATNLVLFAHLVNLNDKVEHSAIRS